MITVNKIKLPVILLLFLSTTSLAMGKNVDSLDVYLKAAAMNNPEIKSAFAAYQSATNKIPQAGAYDDPELEIGISPDPMDGYSGREVATFTLMQMFPWFGTKKAAQNEARHMAQMEYEKYRTVRDELYLKVYSQWFGLCGLQQKLINTRENRDLLGVLEQLLIRNEVASSGMSDILRVQLEITELDNNIESLQSEIRSGKAMFNALLNRSAESEVIVPDSFMQTPFLFDVASIKAKMEIQNPELSMIKEEEFAYKAKGKMQEKMGYPMFGVGLQYMLLDKNKSMSSMSGMNGKDMLMPMVSLSIPIYRNKYKAQQQESKFSQQASQDKFRNKLNILEAELHRLKHLLDDASRQIILSGKQKEIAQTAYNLTVQEFVSGKSDLNDIIQVQRQLLDYKLKKAESVATYNTMVAAIQRLISSEENKQ